MMDAEVCVVGAGAAGGIMALELGRRGVKVVVLESGPRHDFAQRGEYVRRYVKRENPWRSRLEGQDRHTVGGKVPYGLEWRRARGVGGSTLHWEGYTLRVHESDLRLRSLHGIADDWPIAYADLEPYYGRVERIMGVAGIPGNVRGQPVPNGNPFEGYRSEPLPLPPARRTPTGELFTAAAGRLGYHPFPVPASINTEPYDHRPACTYCGWCTFYVCHNDSKTTAGNSFARKALATGRVELRTGCRVVAINRDPGGRVTGVDYLDPDGRAGRQAAGRFVLASYTFENVRLLLTSRIGNGHGQVGRHFMTKMYCSVLGLFPGQRLNRFVAPAACGDILDDFVGDNFDHAGLGFVRGATISCEEQLQPVGAARLPLPPGVPVWGRGYKAHLVENWNAIADLRIQPETLPYEDAFLDLDPRVRDRSGLGMPVVRITWDIHQNERRLIDFVEEKTRGILGEMGAAQIWTGGRFTGAGSAHDLGGCRMGTDPASSVVDPALRVWETPNLYVYGGAVFPSGGGINPTLTIQALVWR